MSREVAVIPLNQLRLLPITIPSYKEQKYIVDKIKGILEKDQKAFNEIDNNSLEMLKNSLLSKAFRGELGTNDNQENIVIKLMREYEK